MTRGLIVICLIATATAGRADEPERWSAGMRAFQTGCELRRSGKPARAEFRKAAAEFAGTADSRHAEPYLNLGNAHYLAGGLPEAIAAFNAGIAIDPSLGRLHEHLARARSDVSIPADGALLAPKLDWQRHLFQPWLSAFAVIAILGASVLVPAGFRLGRRRWLAIGLTLATGAVLAGSAIVLRASYLDDIQGRPVCVLRIDSPLRTGNAESYAPHPDAPLLPRGYEVRRLGTRGAWLHVVCPGGQIGWVPVANVARWDGKLPNLPALIPAS